MTDYVKAWQCIGCGKIEAPQTCIGVCQDRKVEFVYAAEHQRVLRELDDARRQAQALADIVRRIAHTTPTSGGWEKTYRALQAQARETLARSDPGPAAGQPLADLAAA